MKINKNLVSIIIVNFSGKNFLEKCLKSIYDSTYTNYEIILVDNHSDDNSVDFVRKNFPEVNIIKLDKNYGFTYPNNLAAKNARGEYLYFLNNDTEVTPTFLENILKVMETNPKVGICQSLLLKPDGEVDSSGDFIDSLGVPFSSKKMVSFTRHILGAKGAALMIRKSLFEKLGMFDEKFVISFEDVDLGWRCWIYGFEVILVPDSIVYHFGGSTMKKTDIDVDFHGIKNHLIMKFTNFEGKIALTKVFTFFIYYGIKQIRVWFDYKIKGKTEILANKNDPKISKKPNIKLIIKSFIWISKNRDYLKKRIRIISSNRVNTTKELEKKSLIFSM